MVIANNNLLRQERKVFVTYLLNQKVNDFYLIYGYL